MIDHLQITLPIKPFSPVSNVPSFGAGETPNDTPKQNPLSNGVPVSNDYMYYCCENCGAEVIVNIFDDSPSLCADCIAQSADYEQCERCGCQVMDFGGCGCGEWGV